MYVTDLNETVRCLCHVVDVCCKMHKEFQDCCLLNLFDQLVVGSVFSCFLLENYKNIVLRYSLTIQQYVSVEESLN